MSNTAATAATAAPTTAAAVPDLTRITLLVHGGAGVVTRSVITPELETHYLAGLERALAAGHRVLAAAGSALDAVEAAVRALEDDPLFNAGHGAVFTAEGQVELEASIMCGATGQAGAVGLVNTIKNPVSAARRVMEQTRHVMLAGPAAERFAQAQGLEMAPASYFFTQRRWDQLQLALQSGQAVLDHDGQKQIHDRQIHDRQSHDQHALATGNDGQFGTVGAVALDAFGNLAAATSTGGMTNKMAGRMGDTPVCGAGNYADNATAAVSCTGTGEFFMRGVVAHDVAARMRYGGASLGDAVDGAIAYGLTGRSGSGGLIALDAQGNARLSFNCEGMYRGEVRADGQPRVAIFGD